MKNLILAKKLINLSHELLITGKWGNSGSYFENSDDFIETVKTSSPDSSHVSEEGPSEDRLRYIKKLHGRKVRWWADGSHVVKVDSDKVLFMEGNDWNFSHAAGIMSAMQEGVYIEVPAGRVSLIDAAEVQRSIKYDEEGELEYQMGMTRPWEEQDVGKYYAQLIDGNHRAAAAIALGEPYIYVYVAENSRSNILDKDLT